MSVRVNNKKKRKKKLEKISDLVQFYFMIFIAKSMSVRVNFFLPACRVISRALFVIPFANFCK